MSTIHSKFEEITTLYPNNIAYKHEYNKYTYVELNNMSNNLANTLVHNYKNSVKSVFPINTMVPLSRLVEMLKQYKINTIITNNKYGSMLTQLFDGDIIIPNLVTNKCDNLNLNINSDFEFIIFNTSGSTGNPKGVIQTHENMLFSINNYINLYDIKENDNHSLVYPTGFLGGIRDIFVSLLSGATLVYYDKYGIIKMDEWILKNNINILSLPIKFLRDLFNITKTKNIIFKSVKIVRPGADISYKTDFEYFKKYFPNAKYFLLFSSSETGMVLHNILDKSTQLNTELVPLGNPINEVEVYIVDKDDNPIYHENKVGRLMIKSKYLFKGYKNDDIKTNEVLTIKDDYSIYKSNDFVKYINGQIYYEGRSESHVKINGARINPNYISAIASKLVENPYCMFSTKHKNLYLFYETDKNINETKIKKYLLENLEFYMVPARCIKLDKIPQKINGKIDRVLIDSMIDDFILNDISNNDKLTKLQKTLITIFEKNLNKTNIKINDNYFDTLGGDSLTAVLISNDIENELSITLKDNILYEYSTIADISSALEKTPSKYFKWVKHIIKNNSSKTPVFWVTGYPNIIKKHLTYEGDFYYIDSHYNSYATIPSIKDDIATYCKILSTEILKELKTKEIILAGYSIGSIYSIELSKQLKEKGIKIKFLFLLDPRDTINILNGKKTSNYYFYKLFLLLKYVIFYTIWNTQKMVKIEIIKRFTYIHAIYALHRLKYNFETISDKTIIIQRHNNKSSTKHNLFKLFKNIKHIKIKAKKHSDFFSNQSVVNKWIKIFNNYLSNNH